MEHLNHYYGHPTGNASAIAAAAQAAHDVLVGIFPNQKPSLDSALTVSLGTANDGDVYSGLKPLAQHQHQTFFRCV
ncbi:MAG: hypothetical protein WDM71_05850 [Ferruginibacter sp.]